MKNKYVFEYIDDDDFYHNVWFDDSDLAFDFLTFLVDSKYSILRFEKVVRYAR